MNKTRSTILAAAVSGLFLGAATTSCTKASDTSKSEAKGGVSAAALAIADKHACKALNSCKNKGGCKTDKNDCAGKNDCTGKGGCATVQHDCATKNACRNQGGCHGKEGKNACKEQGGCAVPVKKH